MKLCIFWKLIFAARVTEFGTHDAALSDFEMHTRLTESLAKLPVELFESSIELFELFSVTQFIFE